MAEKKITGFRKFFGLDVAKLDEHFPTATKKFDEYSDSPETSKKDPELAKSMGLDYTCRTYEWSDALEGTFDTRLGSFGAQSGLTVPLKLPLERRARFCKNEKGKGRAMYDLDFVIPLFEKGRMIPGGYHKAECVYGYGGEDAEYDFAWSGYPKYGKTIGWKLNCRNRNIDSMSRSDAYPENKIDKRITELKESLAHDIKSYGLLYYAIPKEELENISPF